MNRMLLIARRDLAAYLNGYWGYFIIAAVLMIDGLLFNARALTEKSRYSSEVIEEFFLLSFGLTCIATILLSMRLVAEERQTGTIVLVDSAPVADWQFIGGKYLSVMTVVTLMVLLSIYMPALVFVNGKVSFGHIFAGYVGLLLVGGSVAAIGTFASTVSRSQLVAGVITTVIVTALVLMWLLAKVADDPLKDMLSYLSLYDRHFRGFERGQINTEDVIFYLSLIFVFLLGSSRFMALRRWK